MIDLIEIVNYICLIPWNRACIFFKSRHYLETSLKLMNISKSEIAIKNPEYQIWSYAVKWS